MKRRTLLSLIGITLAAGTAHASLVTYSVFVNSAGLPAGDGFIELQFNQANALTSGAGTASVTQFLSTGYTLGGALLPSSPGVTGSFASPPLVIPNDQAGANIYDEIVVSWGQAFSFLVTVDTAATDSGFYVFLLDSGFNQIVSPLGSGEVANLIIDADGGITTQGSDFTGGSTGIAAVPEPSAAWLLASALGGLAVVFRQKRRTSQA